jgi:putative methyltransferase (TIGR04325 family)
MPKASAITPRSTDQLDARRIAMPNARNVLRLLTPPLVWRLARHLRQDQELEGPFASWEIAARRATGWHDPRLDELALAAALQVKEGAAAFERDSRTYDRIFYSPIIVAALLLALARYRRLNVIDFGGSLGSAYFQHLNLIRALPDVPVSWNVVERPALAKIGVARFQTSELRFHDDLAAVQLDDAVLLFTGSLDYLPDAFGLLEQAVGRIHIVVLDRILAWAQAEHAIFVQRLDSRRFGPVTLATRCFAVDALIGWFFARGFTLVEQFGAKPRSRPQNCSMLFVRG